MPPDTDLLGNPIGDTVAQPPQQASAQTQSADTDLLGNPVQPNDEHPAVSNIKNAIGTDPARNAQSYELAKKTGTDPKYADTNYDQLNKASQTPTQDVLDDFSKQAPNSAKWAGQNPGNAGMIHTDIPAVVNHESIFTDLYKAGLSYARNLNASVLGLEEFFDPSAGTHSNFKSTVDYLDSKINSLVTPGMDAGVIDDIQHGNVENLGRKLLSAIPDTQNAITMALTGGALVNAGVYAVKGIGENYEGVKNKNWLTATGALASGAIQGATQLIPLGFLTKGYPILQATLGPKFATAVMKYATGKWIGSIIAGGATNDIQTLTEASIAKATGENPRAFDGIGSKLAESTVEGILMGPAFLLGEKLAPEAKAIKDLSLSKNSPTATKELLDTLQEHGPLTAHVPVEEFNERAKAQGIKPEDMAKNYGDDVAKSLEVAKQTKGNVKIQLSDLISKGAHNGDLEALGSKANFENRVEVRGDEKATHVTTEQDVEREKAIRVPQEKSIVEKAKDLVSGLTKPKEPEQTEEQKAVLENYKKNGFPTKPPLDMENEWQKGFDAITKKLEKVKKDSLSEEEKSRIAQTSEWLRAKITDEVSELPIYKAKDELDKAMVDTKKSAKNVLDGTASAQEQAQFFNTGLRHLGESDPVLVADKILKSDKDYEINDRLKSQMKLLAGDSKRLLNGDVLDKLMHEGKIGEAHAQLIAKQGAVELVNKKLNDMVQAHLGTRDSIPNLKLGIERLGVKYEDLTQRSQEQLDSLEKLEKESVTEASAAAVKKEMKEKIKPVMAEITRELARITALEERVTASNNAGKILRDLPYKEAQNYKPHLAGEVKAAKLQERARGKNTEPEETKKYSKFAGEEYDQYQARLLNHALVTKSIALRGEINKALQSIEAKAAIVKNPENIAYGHMRAIKNILEGFKQIPKSMNLDAVNAERAKEQEAKGYSKEAIAADTGMVKDEQGNWAPENFVQLKDRIGKMDKTAGELINSALPIDKDFSKLSVNELMSLKNTLNVIKSTGIKNRNITVGGKQVKLDEAITGRLYLELKSTLGFDLGKHPDTQTKIQAVWDKIHSATLNGAFNLPMNISKTMSIDDKVPFMTEAYDNKLVTMANNVLREKREIIEGAKDLIDKHFDSGEKKNLYKRNVIFKAHDGDRTITKSEAMNIIDIARSESGWKRLQSGYQMTEATLNHLMEQVLDKNTFNYLNDRAQFNDILFERQAKLTQDIHNYTPDPVDKRDIATRWGILNGGYFPLKYDPNSIEYVHKEGVEIGSPKIPFSPYIEDGMLQNRQEDVKIPPDYRDLVYSLHLTKVAKYLGFSKELNEINSVINHPLAQVLLKKSLGPDGYKNYVNHLNYVVNGNPHDNAAIESISRGLRTMDTIYHVGTRPQLLPRKLEFDLYMMGNDPEIGYGNAISYLTKAYDFGRDGYSKIYKEAVSKSELLKERHINALNTEMYNMEQTFKQVHLHEKIAGFLRQVDFVAEKTADRVATCMWKDMYDRHVFNGHKEQDAVAMADTKVGTLMGSGNPVFRPLPLHGELGLTFAPMHTYLTTILNRAITEGRIKYIMTPKEIIEKPWLDAVYRAAIVGRQIYKYGAVPYLMDTGTQNFIQGKDEDDDKNKPKDWVSNITHSLPFKATARLLPIGGDKIVAAEDYPKMKEKFINSVPQLDAAFKMYESGKTIIPAIAKLVEGNPPKDKDLRDALAAPQMLLSIPEQLDNIVMNLHRDVVQDNFNGFSKDMLGITHSLGNISNYSEFVKGMTPASEDVARISKDIGGPLHKQSKY